MKVLRRAVLWLLVVGALFLSVYFITQQEDPRPTGSPSISADSPRAGATATTSAEIPVDELRSALTDVCSNAAPDSVDKQWTQEEIQRQIDAFNEQKQTLSESLSASPSAEHLHLAALLVDDPLSRIELLNAAMVRNPADPFLVWGAVQICSEAIETTPCPLREWERLLVAIDGQNSESWIRICQCRRRLSAFCRDKVSAYCRLGFRPGCQSVQAAFSSSG